MSQNHERTVILRGSIVCENLDDCVERCAYRGARLNKEIHSQMNRSALFYRMIHTPKKRGAVKGPRFVVTPDTHAHARAFHR